MTTKAIGLTVAAVLLDLVLLGSSVSAQDKVLRSNVFRPPLGWSAQIISRDTAIARDAKGGQSNTYGCVCGSIRAEVLFDPKPGNCAFVQSGGNSITCGKAQTNACTAS